MVWRKNQELRNLCLLCIYLHFAELTCFKGAELCKNNCWENLQSTSEIKDSGLFDRIQKGVFVPVKIFLKQNSYSNTYYISCAYLALQTVV